MDELPGRDGTGPLGRGPVTGRGTGFCSGGYRRFGCGYGRGFGFRRAFGPANLPYGRDFYNADDEREFLTRQAEYLQRQAERINKRLSELDDSAEAEKED